MISGKNILIIGGTGSLGNVLAEKYVARNKVFIYSRCENNQWNMKRKFEHAGDNIHFFIGDIRDRDRLLSCIKSSSAHIVIIAAALKHIDICENNTSECIGTNMEGTRNVIRVVSDNVLPLLETVLFVSTDKACEPVNVYGMCKSISERVMVENLQSSTIKFVNVRYGNVLFSNGSLLPLFKSIGEDPGRTAFTITDSDMTRFFMTLDDSVRLIDRCIEFSSSGDTYVPSKIASYSVLDIANWFSKRYDKPVIQGSIRPGEKLHETLISFTESLRTIRDGDEYFVIKPSSHAQLPLGGEGGHVIMGPGGFQSNTDLSEFDGETVMNRY